MNAPILSIVTVTADDSAGLRRTLLSLAKVIGNADVEVIVIDGSRTAAEASLNTMYVGKSRDGVLHVQEADDGVYDAMNRGLGRTRGRWVWFLNGGDEAVQPAQLLLELRTPEIEGCDLIYYDYRLAAQGVMKHRRAHAPWWIWHGLPTSHQAILYRRAILSGHRYDVSFKVAADYALTAALVNSGAVVRANRREVATFYVGGMSSQSYRRLRYDADRVQREILAIPRPAIWLSTAIHKAAFERRRRFGRRRHSRMA